MAVSLFACEALQQHMLYFDYESLSLSLSQNAATIDASSAVIPCYGMHLTG